MIFNAGYFQTKKEKIQILTFQIDSLTQVVKSKMINLDNKDTVISELENQIQFLNAIIVKRKLDENALKESIYKKDIELQKKK
jgi:hypothetical protein